MLEGDDLSARDRFGDRAEGLLSAREPRLDERERSWVDSDADRLQLAQRTISCGSALGMPHPSGQPQQRGLGRRERDRRKGVRGEIDAVALLVTVAHGLERHAKVAQLGLVPLEGLLEGVLADRRRVVLDRVAQLTLGDRSACL